MYKNSKCKIKGRPRNSCMKQDENMCNFSIKHGRRNNYTKVGGNKCDLSVENELRNALNEDESRCDVTASDKFCKDNFINNDRVLPTRENPYVCCNRRFSRECTFKKHSLAHLSVKKECRNALNEDKNSCDVIASDKVCKENIMNNDRVLPTRENLYICCNRRFSRSCTFKKHSLAHLSVRNEPRNALNEDKSRCDVIACNKVCKDNFINNDRVLPTRKNPYICCNRRFSRVCTFKKHNLTHLSVKKNLRNALNEDKSSCNVIVSDKVCKDSFINNDRVLPNRKNPYICCNRRFSRVCTFKKHSLAHLSVKNELKNALNEDKSSCNVTASDKICKDNCINSDRVLPTRKNPYICCNRRFSRVCTFKKHSLAHLSVKNELKNALNEDKSSCDVTASDKICKDNCINSDRILPTRKDPYICCNRRFSRECTFKKHSLAHLSVKNGLRNALNEDKSSCDVTASDKICKDNCINSVRVLPTRKDPYICCNRRFSRVCTFKKHSLTHKKEKLQISKLSQSKLKQKAHCEKKCIIYVKKLRICEYSNENTEIDCLKDYDIIHWRGTSYVCMVCNKGFALKCNFVIHSLTHKKESFVCGICNESFPQKCSLEAHYSAHKNQHFSDTADDKLREEAGVKPSQVSEKNLNSCDILETVLSNKSNISVHCNLTDQRPHVCEFCEKIFKTKLTLKAHYFIHFPHKKENAYICGICGRAVASKSRLQLHYRTHTSEKPYVCEICQKGFGLRVNLNAHYRTHTKEKPYVCEICSRGFAERKKLKSHYFTHTNEKPHVCHICKRSFNRKDNLKSHYRIHTDEKPYMCEICKTSYSYKTSLKSHLLVHQHEKSHICEICEKPFRHKSTLLQHYCFIHGRTKLYICELCGKRFASRSHLKRHCLHHTNEKPHACDICHKKYKDKTNLHKHYTTHLCKA